jgi:hypothetical protein
MNKLVLVMIIRNESKIITRCLDNIKKIVSAVCIIDTGSNDDTVNIVNLWLQKNEMQGQIIQKMWKNFGWNRSESFTEAKKWLQNNNFNLNKTYALFIDADMVLKKLPSFNINDLNEKGYLLRQYHNELSYYNLRIAKFEENWVCEGVTHEYWKIKDQDYFAGSWEGLEIEDREDGGCKSDKFERDKQLLEKGLEEDPNNVRYLFYLAQTYSCLNNYEKSNEFYKKRIEKGGWYEEVWYSHFKIVSNYLSMKQPLEAIEWCTKGYHFYPNRTEAFDAICKYLRENDYNNMSYFFAEFASNIKLNKEDKLFISLDCYNYKFIETKSFTAYYSNKIMEGYLCCEKLLNMKDYHNKELTLQNILFYLPSLSYNNKINLEFNYKYVSFHVDSNKKLCFIKDNSLYIGNIVDKKVENEEYIINLQNYINNIEKIYWLNENIIVKLNSNKHLIINVNSKELSKKKNQYIPIPIINQTITSKLNEIYKGIVKSNFIEFINGYIGIIHIHEQKRNKYYYMFLWISKDMKQYKKSKTLYFLNKGDEDIICISKYKKCIYILQNYQNIYSLIEINSSNLEKMIEEF